MRKSDIVAMGIACVIVLAGLGAIITVAMLLVNRRVRSLEAKAAVPPAHGIASPYGNAFEGSTVNQPHELAVLFYILSGFFWPAAFGLGLYFLGSARTARMGRRCIAIGWGVIGTVSVLTCIAMSAITVSESRRTASNWRPPPVSSTSTTPASPSASELPKVPRASRDDATVVRVGPREVANLRELNVRIVAADKRYVPSGIQAGERAFVYDVSLENHSSRVISTYGAVTLTDEDGREYHADFAGKSPTLGPRALSPGEISRGWVTFKLASGAKPKLLHVTAPGYPFEIAELEVPE